MVASVSVLLNSCGSVAASFSIEVVAVVTSGEDVFPVVTISYVIHSVIMTFSLALSSSLTTEAAKATANSSKSCLRRFTKVTSPGVEWQRVQKQTSGQVQGRNQLLGQLQHRDEVLRYLSYCMDYTSYTPLFWNGRHVPLGI